MKQLQGLKLKPAPDWQRERLARWLAEWALDQRLAGAEPSDGYRAGSVGSVEPATAGNGIGPRPHDRLVAPGQVRLLDPRLPGCRHRPVFVAVLLKLDSGDWLAAPFSRFAEPAVPGEFLTGLAALPLRVLACDQAHAVGGAILQQGWVAGRLGRRVLNDAAILIRRGDGAIPARLLRRMAPPLIHPDDPRHLYRREMTQMMAGLAIPPGKAVCREEGNGRFLYRPDPSEALPLAAEPKPARYGANPPRPRRPKRNAPQ